MSERQQIPLALRREPVIAVLRAPTPADYAPVIEALHAGGVTQVEVTLSTPGTLDHLAALAARCPAETVIGVGTVTTPEQAERAIAEGAAYLVTPTTDHAVIGAALAHGVPVFPGGLTPTELHSAWQRGVAAVKVFPASRVGPGYLADLRGPFPGIEVIPSGGVTADDALAWLAAGACAVSVGGPLVRDAFAGGSLAALTARARELTSRIADAGFGVARDGGAVSGVTK
ncbi:bifunctional 4-hydroxy-2-oxoglutarate aldolase/2-dehydro-3-deoxy-phosphogluconate aldolase [Leucobacter chromiireducens]|uniref:bifunctional 4-hydroxy-2-oxoglutarate aldolase/2-dehydro-3-deoxy-phosphogluconate aldolase n=1 Tax=Leucobacter chromiireducens TaxID=283877 RepID=UPI000F63B914|nr:bifunctional 4-hydroxy-2-oxoglutarate aldolase/2-dehydro-3-deoxy-phosphogluconate aldolase [Leucobacter chromiireducens]